MSVEEVVEEIDGKTSGSNAKEHSEFARSGFTEFFLHDAYEPTVISINGNPSWKANILPDSQQYRFTKPRCSLPCSQKPATAPCT